MQITQSIPIYIDSTVEDKYNRIVINDGTCPPDELHLLNYVSGAFVPRPNWRSLTEEEKRILYVSVPPASYGSAVGLTKIPEYLVIPFRELARARPDRMKEGFFRTIVDILPVIKEEILIDLLVELDKFVIQSDSLTLDSIYSVPVGRYTTATESIEKKFTGMHLDDWDKAPVSECHETITRISINLSEESRYLLFINLSVMKMNEMLGHSLDSVDAVTVARDFMKKFPDYPVLKLEVMPGEAYITSVENVLHDGNNENMSKDDITLVFKGYFGSN